MGDSIARLYDEDEVPLAGLTRVKAYMRKGKDGKTVAVSAYTRSVTRMSFKELQDEFKKLENASSPQDRNRRQQVLGEIRFRGFEPGEAWDESKGKEALRRLRERTANNSSRTQDASVENLKQKTDGGGDFRDQEWYRFRNAPRATKMRSDEAWKKHHAR